ncbi:MAG: helix-turn-helix transcriptional regulator [Anaerolineaceae bacterium]|nr:helix-turn-helix transcriptional regulator [Anaerolineaceae bacterium]
MPKKINPPPNPNRLTRFILDNMEGLNLTVTELARKAGISQSHLSSILLEKANPSVEIINKLADFFNTPRTYLYKLMDWIDIDSQEDQDQLTYLLGLAKQDPQFAELVELYSQCTTPDQRKKLIRIIRASIE